MKHVIRVLAIGGSLIAAAVTPAPASADIGTWTKLTGPRGPGVAVYAQPFDLNGAAPTITVSGLASPDVSAVNIYCFSNNDQFLTGSDPLNSSPLPVSGGRFSGSGLAAPPLASNCVLRAVPDNYLGISGNSNSGYVGSFTGPTWFGAAKQLQFSSGSKIRSWVVFSSHPHAGDTFSSPDAGGVAQATPNNLVPQRQAQLPAGMNLLGLLGQNVVSSGPSTRSGIMIDGHHAYLPNTLSSFASDANAVPAVTFAVSRSTATGALTVRETEPLRWCTGNAFPKSTGTCDAVPTGVSLRRTIETSRGSAAVTVHDKFVSIDHRAHTLRAEYSNTVGGLSNQGNPGIRLPGQSSFTLPNPGASNTHLPVGPHTMYLTSDSHGLDGTPDRALNGLTYSGRPAFFMGAARSFALRYTRSIPKNGVAAMTFGLEAGFSMSTVTSLATAEQKAVTPRLAMTAPRKTTADNTPTVRGRITNATNGLPAKVRVTIGTKSKRVAVGLDGRFHATFTLANGKHTAKVKATDPSAFLLTARRTFTVT
jgi:hypothetical protein